MPLRYQLHRLRPADFDLRLAEGDRRVGRLLYRTSCAQCVACEPIRVPVDRFAPSRSQKRALQKNRDVQITIGPATYSDEKLALYNRHKQERGLTRGTDALTRVGYEGWFVHSCVETLEMRYTVDDRLIGVGIVDRGAQDASSVYFYFDPDEDRRSLGVFSALAEIMWLQSQGGRYLYLGLWVEDCRHLYYKASYAPHERRMDGEWREIPTAAPARVWPDDDADDGTG
jgi:arginine-tRNA-protein transferase